MIKQIFVAAGLMLATTSAMAVDGKGFMRVEAGRSDFSAFGSSSNDTAVGVRGGYYFNQHFGIEGFYTRYGADSADGLRVEADGLGVGVFAKANFGAEPYTGFHVSGRAGAAHDRLDLRVSGLGSVEDSDTVPYFGVGVGFDFNHNVGVSLHYDYQEPKVFETRFKVETLTLGVEYRF